MAGDGGTFPLEACNSFQWEFNFWLTVYIQCEDKWLTKHYAPLNTVKYSSYWSPDLTQEENDFI